MSIARFMEAWKDKLNIVDKMSGRFRHGSFIESTGEIDFTLAVDKEAYEARVNHTRQSIPWKECQLS